MGLHYLRQESFTNLKIRSVQKGCCMFRWIVLVYSCLCLSACASFPTCAPSACRHNTSIDVAVSPLDSSSTWGLANLQPDENTILIDGKTIPISIDIKTSGTSNYALTFSTNKDEFRPFLIQTTQGSGEIDFSGTVTWFVDVRGTSETVKMSLYHIDRSPSRNTEVKTLVRQITRNYQIVCDKNEFAVILMLKRLFGLCKCE